MVLIFKRKVLRPRNLIRINFYRIIKISHIEMIIAKRGRRRTSRICFSCRPKCDLHHVFWYLRSI